MAEEDAAPSDVSPYFERSPYFTHTKRRRQLAAPPLDAAEHQLHRIVGPRPTRRGPDGILIEQHLSGSPWRLLVACILLNKTQGRQLLEAPSTGADNELPVLLRLFERAPGPLALIDLGRKPLEVMLRLIGLNVQKANSLVLMSEDFVHSDWTAPSELYGLGEYADNAFAIFIRARRDVEPSDVYLRRYLGLS